MVTLVGQPSAVERASVWLGEADRRDSDACEARDRKIRLAQRVLEEINERTE